MLFMHVPGREPMERGEAIARLKRHKTEFERLGVEHLTCSARRREVRHEKTLMSISSLTIPRGLSGFSR